LQHRHSYSRSIYWANLYLMVILQICSVLTVSAGSVWADSTSSGFPNDFPSLLNSNDPSFSLLQLRAEKKSHPVPPTSCLSPNSDFKVCSMWADAAKIVSGPNASSNIEAGVYSVLESQDGSLKLQAFMCQQGEGAANIQGLAVQVGLDRASFLRSHSAHTADSQSPSSWNISVNGDGVDYQSLPKVFSGGLWMLQEGEDGRAGFSWPYSWPDGLPLCLGDMDRRMAFHAGLAHDGRFMPALHVELATADIKDVGLCGSDSSKTLLSWDDAVFSSSEVAQLCGACGLTKGPKGCRPAARSLNLLQGMSTPEQACSEARIPFSDARERCSGLDAPGDDAFFRACVIEYCVSGGDDKGVMVQMATEHHVLREF